MRVHAIQTGTVAVKTRQRQGVGHGLARPINTLVDREWTEPLPILAWAIEHPEGVIVVDTGETARATEKGYFLRCARDTEGRCATLGAGADGRVMWLPGQDPDSRW